jgi:predicted CopG family antitoxin
MEKKLTITIDDQVYNALRQRVEREHISKFIEGLVRPHVFPQKPEKTCRQASRDETSEAEELEWGISSRR